MGKQMSKFKLGDIVIEEFNDEVYTIIGIHGPLAWLQDDSEPPFTTDRATSTLKHYQPPAPDEAKTKE